MYLIKIGNKNIGYIDEKRDIDTYINSLSESNTNIAFIDVKEPIECKMQLVNRSEQDINNKLDVQLKNNIDIQYTTYAITYNKTNVAYLSTEEEAQKVIEKVKEENKKAEDLQILQVYSDDYSKIESSSEQDSIQKVNDKIKNEKEQATIKIAQSTTSASKGVKFSVKPLNGIITSRFGGRTSPGGIGSTNHKGLDIASKTGTSIKAVASGTVKFAGYKGSLGNLVIIDNGNGVNTYYGHCSKIYVSKGQKVDAGDVISAVGQTGSATGPHLHFEVRINGKSVNPQNYIYK